jgi:arylsulfatase A-like enzyme
MLFPSVATLALVASGITSTQAQAYQYGPGQFPMAGQTGPEPGASKKRPNIVFILTDDQDLHMQSLEYMPFVKKHLLDQGTFYKRHFCTTAICCPSRVTLWTGKAAHNTNVTDVFPPYGKTLKQTNLFNIRAADNLKPGGYPKFLSQGFNENYLPVWLQSAGYSTYYTGKLFNAHTVDNYNAPHAAGWNGSVCLTVKTGYT